jgi:hypothetical protein
MRGRARGGGVASARSTYRATLPYIDGTINKCQEQVSMAPLKDWWVWWRCRIRRDGLGIHDSHVGRQCTPYRVVRRDSVECKEWNNEQLDLADSCADRRTLTLIEASGRYAPSDRGCHFLLSIDHTSLATKISSCASISVHRSYLLLASGGIHC